MINSDNRELTATKSKNKFTLKLADVIRRNFRDPNTKLGHSGKEQDLFCRHSERIAKNVRNIKV